MLLEPIKISSFSFVIAMSKAKSLRNSLRFRLSTCLLLMIPCGCGFLWLADIVNDRPIDWVAFSATDLRDHISTNKTVLVFATADWDPTSIAVEKKSIDTFRVRTLLRKRHVIAMRADFNQPLHSRGRGTIEWQKSIDVFATPVVAVYHRKSENHPNVIRGWITEKQIIDALTTLQQ